MQVRDAGYVEHEDRFRIFPVCPVEIKEGETKWGVLRRPGAQVQGCVDENQRQVVFYRQGQQTGNRASAYAKVWWARRQDRASGAGSTRHRNEELHTTRQRQERREIALCISLGSRWAR